MIRSRRHHECGSRPRVRRGFTLIEAVATIVILGIVGVGASNIILSSTEGYASAANTAQLHNELSVTLDRIVRELRKIEPDGGAVGVAPHIDSVNPSSIVWRSGADETSSLTLNGTDLELAIDDGPASVLIADVAAVTIQCYDENNAALAATLSGAACDPIRRVSVSLTASRNGVSESLRCKLYLRGTMAGVGP